MTGRAAGDGNTLAVELDRLRRRAGLSFRDLSRLTGHPVSTLHNALTDTNDVAWSGTLGIPVDGGLLAA